MESDLRELVATVQNPNLRTLLEGLFAPHSDTWRAYRDAPSAKHYHHAYGHGLLEHSLGVAQAVSAISNVFPGINRDLAVTGALVHDIGKLEAYTTTVDGQIELTDLGRLHGEIALGYFRIRSAIEAQPGFPEKLAEGLLHIILSHHGCLEHGSPVVPAMREATLVHAADNLGSKLGSYDRVQADLDAGEFWARFDRGIGAAAYFGPTAPVQAEPTVTRAAA